MKPGVIVLISALALVAVGGTAAVIMQQRANTPQIADNTTYGDNGKLAPNSASTSGAKHAPAAQYTYVTLAGGDAASVRLLTPLSSETSRIGDPIAAVLISPWLVGEQTALPAGTRVEGRVTNAESTGRLKHNAKLAFEFNQVLLPGGQRVGIVSTPLSLEAGGETKRDVITIGVGTVAGGVIGAATGNTKRGAIIGAVAGTGAALYQKGDPVVLPAGSTLRLALSEGLRVSVKKVRV